MSGLGLRYCPNHPEVPLILVSLRTATFWKCEHESDCIYTEPAHPGGAKNRRVLAINGRGVVGGSRPTGKGRNTVYGGSPTEKDAER